MKTWTKLVVGVALLLLPTTVTAHEIEIPATVTADGDGFFSYGILVVITSAVELAYIDVDGMNNTDIGHWIADGFCMTVIEPDVFIVTMEGHLLDPYESGSVTYTNALCDGWTGQGTTTILPPSVATTTVSWSGLKALYR